MVIRKIYLMKVFFCFNIDLINAEKASVTAVRYLVSTSVCVCVCISVFIGVCPKEKAKFVFLGLTVVFQLMSTKKYS